MITNQSGNHQVVLFQYRMLTYRAQLFELLRLACAARSIELHVVYGQATAQEAMKKDTFDLPWGRKVRNRWFNVRGRDLVWQPFPADLKAKADLVIVMQENRLLANYALQLGLLAGRARIAFWGHGRNYQSKAPSGLRERWKRFWLNRVDWWFAYTEMSRRDVESNGYEPARITVLNNAIDNSGFEQNLAGVSEADVTAFRTQLGVVGDAPVMIFCGSLYADKRIDLMVQACDELAKKLGEFHFIVIGAGPESAKLAKAAESRPWLHPLGVKNGRDKALAFRSSCLTLNPGLVGLHVVDSFVSACPMVTLASSAHSPEIEYLKNGVNGLILDCDDAADIANRVFELLCDKVRLAAMRIACLESARCYTLDAMVENFANGMQAALGLPQRGR